MQDSSFPSTSDHSGPVSRRPFSFAAGALAGVALLGAALSALLTGCAGTGSNLPAPTAKHVEYAGRNGQVTTLATLNVGRKLYIHRCSACHSLKDPASIMPADWPDMVDRMSSNAKLNPEQQRAITQYLVAVSAVAHDSGTDAAGAKPAAAASAAGDANPAPAPAK